MQTKIVHSHFLLPTTKTIRVQRMHENNLGSKNDISKSERITERNGISTGTEQKTFSILV